MGAVATGLFPDIQSAAKQMVHARSRIEPNPATHQLYRFYVDQYINTYPPLQPLIHETVRHVSQNS